MTSPSSLSRRASTTTGEFTPENGMGWNTILSFWGPAYFQVIYVSLSCSRRSRSPWWDIKNQQLVPFTSHFWSNHDDLATYAARKHGTYTILHIHKNKQSVLDFLSTNTKRKHGSFWFGTISWCLFIAWVIYWPYLFGRAYLFGLFIDVYCLSVPPKNCYGHVERATLRVNAVWINVLAINCFRLYWLCFPNSKWYKPVHDINICVCIYNMYIIIHYICIFCIHIYTYHMYTFYMDLYVYTIKTLVSIPSSVPIFRWPCSWPCLAPREQYDSCPCWPLVVEPTHLKNVIVKK